MRQVYQTFVRSQYVNTENLPENHPIATPNSLFLVFRLHQPHVSDVEHGLPDPGPPVGVAVVEHAAPRGDISYPGVADHLGVPAFRRDIDPHLVIHTLPLHAVVGLRVPDAGTLPAVRVPHAIGAAVFDDVRPGDGMLARRAVIDARDAGRRPLDAISRLGVADAVAGLRLFSSCPAGAGHVPHPPHPGFDQDRWRGRRVWVETIAPQHRRWGGLFEPPAAVGADRASDEEEEIGRASCRE